MHLSPHFPAVLTAEEMLRADAHTIKTRSVTATQLMEKAGACALREILLRRNNLNKMIVLAGRGNNGGDGYVVARLAREAGIDCVVVPFSEGIKAEAKAARDKYLDAGGIEQPKFVAELKAEDCVVDALYGIGFRGMLEGDEALVAEQINAERKKREFFVVSLDLPSGALGNTGQIGSVAVRADLTVVFQNFKPVHFTFPGAEYSGEKVLVDLEIVPESKPTSFLITKEGMRELAAEFLLLKASDHKGVRGHLGIVGGAPGHSGAAILSSRAGFRAGAGLVTVVSDVETCKQVVVAEPEVMTSPVNFLEAGEKLNLTKFKAVVVGPGMVQGEKTFQQVVDVPLPLVIDASALGFLAKLNKQIPNAILTPHPGEMGQLMGSSSAAVQADRFSIVKLAAAKYQAITILKGAYTLIGTPAGEIYISPWASPNLGTAGSGDVLAGLIGGLLVRGIPNLDAAIIAVYLHGKIGSTLLPEGIVGSVASEFADAFPIEVSNLLQSVSHSGPN